MKANVKGTMLGMRIAAATFSLNGSEEGSSVLCELTVACAMAIEVNTYGCGRHMRLRGR